VNDKYFGEGEKLYVAGVEMVYEADSI